MRVLVTHSHAYTHARARALTGTTPTKWREETPPHKKGNTHTGVQTKQRQRYPGPLWGHDSSSDREHTHTWGTEGTATTTPPHTETGPQDTHNKGPTTGGNQYPTGMPVHSEGGQGEERERERERGVCVCVCVCV